MPSLIKPDNELSQIGLYRRKRKAKLRAEVYTLLGNKCVCCGEDREVFLTLDHIYNNGAWDRKRVGSNVERIYLRALERTWQYQILCRNCNWAKRFGVCPHQESPQARQPDDLAQDAKQRAAQVPAQEQRPEQEQGEQGDGNQHDGRHAQDHPLATAHRINLLTLRSR